MDGGRLASAIEATCRRASALVEPPAHGTAADDPHPRLKELGSALEELRAAAEEIRRRDEEDEATREMLEARSRHYRELFERTPVAYLAADGEGVVREANRATGLLLRCDQGHLVGQPLACLVAASDRALMRAQLADLRRGRIDRVEDVEVRLQGRRARVVTAAVTLSAVRAEDGRLVGLGVLLRDLRDRKQAEAAARAASAARVADDAKDEILGTLSHELRTPLNVILGWTEMLRNEGIDEANAPLALESIDRNAKHLNRLVGDILDLSRPRQGRLQLDARPCDVHRALAAALDTVWTAAATRRLHVRAILGDSRPVLGDTERLARAFANLLGNAVKFSPEGGTITVDALPSGRHVEVRVHDEGIGIAPDLLPHVFERFRQGDPAPEHLTEGLGIGLSVVREVVASHGGDVWAESDGAGRGATFTVRLPVAPSEPGTDRAASDRARSAPQAEVDHPLAGFRLLVAGPPGGGGRQISDMLARAGAEVLTTESEADALARAASRPPDALVVAAGSAHPETLIDLARHVEERFNGNLPVVALTPSDGPDGDWSALEAMLQLYVTTPPDAARVVPLVGAAARLRTAAASR